MENRSVGFTIRPYLVRVMVLGVLCAPLPVTVPRAAAFSLASNVSAVAEERAGPEKSLAAWSSAAAEPDAANC